MKQEVELTPLLPDPLENLFGFTLDHDVEWHADRRLQCLRQRLDVRPRLFVQIGHGKIGSQCAKRLCATPCDRLIVGDADDQPLLALQRNLGLGEYRDVHDTLSRSKFGDGRFMSSASVCWAIISSSSVGTT